MKMKKWMGACLMASMVLTQSPVNVLANEFEVVNETAVSEVTNSIQQAINDAKDGDTIQIQGEQTVNITVPENKKLTLQFAPGAKLTNVDKKDTLTIGKGATVTITGTGVIQNTSHAKAALINNGTVILDGGIKVDRSNDHDQNGSVARNSYYTVVNHGTMTINHATIDNAGDFSSCIININENNNGQKATLVINDGANITGGLNCIKNDENGKLEVNGGTIISKHQIAIMNWNEAKISGGHIENTGEDQQHSGTAVYNANYNEATSGTMTISGDVVIKGKTAVAVVNRSGQGTSTKSSLKVEGGTIIGTDCAIQAKDNTETTVSQGEIKGKLDVAQNSSVTVNGGNFTEKLPDSIKPQGNVHVHTIVKVSKAPTCTEEGVEEHWQCSDCKKTFADEKGQTDLAAPTVIPATGHDYTWVIDKEPTKDEAGAKYQYCMVCHHKTDPVSIPAIGYTEKVENAVYRAYNPNNGEHLYTANYDEFRSITSIGWHDEGIAFMTESAKEGHPLYRVYNPNSGLHHYTIDENEKNVLVSLGWRDEDVTMYTSKKPQCAAVFRVYNPNGGQHHYTKDANERNVLVSLGWVDEGIAFRTAEIPSK